MGGIVMCGITGWIDYSRNISNEKQLIQEMTETLARRGPDGSGYWLSDHALFGHRRLIVVDPEGGRQPMRCTWFGNTYTIVYNGELYNTEDIRHDLLVAGHTFGGWSDTEVLLHAYAEWGDACLERLNGIFAFAVWDEKNERLFLARDRIGVKPLFYSEKGGTLLFGSEIKALLKHPGISHKVRAEGLSEIFAVGPARTPGHGVFSDISEVRPGHSLVYDREGLHHRQYWALKSFEHPDDFSATAAAVRALVCDAVKRQLVSDVPLCVLLSGGLDSSAISALAAGVYSEEQHEKIRTFSIDYVDNDKNFRAGAFQPNADAPWIRSVSEYLGTAHEDFLIDTPELVEALHPSVLARDLPGMTDIDASLLVFSRRIRRRATVGLSGECADEVFGGYPWFYDASDKDTFPWSRRLDERVKLFSPELTAVIRPREYVAARYGEALNEVPPFDGETKENAGMRALFYLNLTRWMPTLLDRKDRMSMYSGLELRVPFCDHRLVEYVWNVPWKFKNYKGREKGLLRHALAGLLPEDVLWRKKSPYPKTHNPNYIEALRQLTLRMLDDANAPLHPFIDKRAVRELAATITRDTDIPWFGQLMNAPQLLAYLLQVDWWMRAYEVDVSL
jgi:asparagine synthase (glutamine-hydrolysing)